MLGENGNRNRIKKTIVINEGNQDLDNATTMIVMQGATFAENGDNKYGYFKTYDYRKQLKGKIILGALETDKKGINIPFKSDISSSIDEEKYASTVNQLKQVAEQLLANPKSVAYIYSEEIPGMTKDGKTPSPDDKITINGKETTIRDAMLERAKEVGKILKKEYKIDDKQIQVGTTMTAGAGNNIQIEIKDK